MSKKGDLLDEKEIVNIHKIIIKPYKDRIKDLKFIIIGLSIGVLSVASALTVRYEKLKTNYESTLSSLEESNKKWENAKVLLGGIKSQLPLYKELRKKQLNSLSGMDKEDLEEMIKYAYLNKVKE